MLPEEVQKDGEDEENDEDDGEQLEPSAVRTGRQPDFSGYLFKKKKRRDAFERKFFEVRPRMPPSSRARTLFSKTMLLSFCAALG